MVFQGMFSRRDFIKVGGVWVLTSCSKTPQGSSPVAAAPVEAAPAASAASAPSAAAPATCQATEDNILGPYYRAGAPLRTEIAAADVPGTRIAIGGRVWGAGCTTPLEGAVLDVWQADKDGRYDNDHHDAASDGHGPFRLRGKLTAAKGGAYEIRSVLPGHYLNGPKYRPAHVHVTVSAPGYRPLTTQLYFEGDPYNSIDGFIKQSLIIKFSERGGVRTGNFDFVLEPA